MSVVGSKHEDAVPLGPARRSSADRNLRLAMTCTLVAWGLAVVRFFVALVHHEAGLDAILAAVLSAALPGIGAAAAASAFVRSRRSRVGSDNVIPGPWQRRR